jgi:flavin reductase (DIM6/NTAB) family NADH-FMN oxidoreductase RutF
VPIDQREFRNCLGRFATGVTVVTATHGEHQHGMTANAFMSGSLDPPLVVVSISHKARIKPLLEASSRFAISVLAEDQEALALHFSGRPQGLEVAIGFRDELPLIAGAVAHLTCDVENAVESGDHTLFLGRVDWLWYREGRPLTFFGGRFFGLEGAPLDPTEIPSLDTLSAPRLSSIPGHTLVADYP